MIIDKYRVPVSLINVVDDAAKVLAVFQIVHDRVVMQPRMSSKAIRSDSAKPVTTRFVQRIPLFQFAGRYPALKGLSFFEVRWLGALGTAQKDDHAALGTVAEKLEVIGKRLTDFSPEQVEAAGAWLIWFGIHSMGAIGRVPRWTEAKHDRHAGMRQFAIPFDGDHYHFPEFKVRADKLHELLLQFAENGRETVSVELVRSGLRAMPGANADRT